MNEPLLNSPNSMNMYCDKCKCAMNNNYYYSVGSGGYINQTLCPKCVPKNSTRYYKYIFRRHSHSVERSPKRCKRCIIS